MHTKKFNEICTASTPQKRSLLNIHQDPVLGSSDIEEWHDKYCTPREKTGPGRLLNPPSPLYPRFYPYRIFFFPRRPSQYISERLEEARPMHDWCMTWGLRWHNDENMYESTRLPPM